MGVVQASDYLENKLVDHIFRTATFAKPAGIFIALFTVAPTDAGGGTEVAGGSYARVSVPPLDTNWTATQGGTAGPSTGNTGLTSNAVAITYPSPTANWGTVVAFGIFDAAVAGNLLVWDVLTAPRTINSGDGAPLFSIGAMQVTFA
jgi:hypothetical protein